MTHFVDYMYAMLNRIIPSVIDMEAAIDRNYGIYIQIKTSETVDELKALLGDAFDVTPSLYNVRNYNGDGWLYITLKQTHISEE